MSEADATQRAAKSRAIKSSRIQRYSHVQLRPRLAVALIYLLTLLIDLMIVGVGAALLWQFAGTTVVDGPFWLRACVFLLLTVLFGVRSISQRTLRDRLSDRYLARLRAAGVQLGTHTVLLLAVALAWAQTGIYFIGWVFCFAASAVAVGYFWMLISSLAAEQKLSITVQRMLGMLIGIVGVISASPIHAWANGILESVVVLLTGAILLAAITLFWGAAIAEDTAVAPDGAS